MNLITTYLVLLAGTGSDHRLTKWSAKACEEHAGLGKPRAKQAIEELIGHGLVERSPTSTMMLPQYVLPVVPLEDEPIFLPVQLVTGLAGETPILRRVRQSGDALALEMLIDLYGLVQVDATYGLPLRALRKSAEPAQKVCETGVNAVWALPNATGLAAQGDWAGKHPVKDKKGKYSWEPFWDRVRLLQNVGALLFEPWVFDGVDVLAEPIMPVDPGVLYSFGDDGDEVATLTRLMQQSSIGLAEGREYIFDRHGNDVLICLPLHHQAPALVGVAKLRVEADTPGRRLAYALRMDCIERNTAAYQQLVIDTIEGRHNRPVSPHQKNLVG
jgi:hypothetical protein